MNVNNMLMSAGAFGARYGTELAIGCGTLLSTAAMVATVTATKKTIEDLKDIPDAPVGKKVKRVYRHWLPPLILKAAADTCLVMGVKKHQRQVNGITSALAASEMLRKEYAEAAKRTVGEEKEKEIRETAEKEKLKKHPLKDISDVIEGQGSQLFFDTVTGTYFWSDTHRIRDAVQFVNESDGGFEEFIDLNEFYYHLHRCDTTEFGTSHGIKVANDACGHRIKWTVDIGSAKCGAGDRMSCLTISYRYDVRYLV